MADTCAYVVGITGGTAETCGAPAVVGVDGRWRCLRHCVVVPGRMLVQRLELGWEIEKAWWDGYYTGKYERVVGSAATSVGEAMRRLGTDAGTDAGESEGGNAEPRRYDARDDAGGGGGGSGEA